MTGVRRQQGYIMLPVMITVALVATIAFMMSHESNVNIKTLNNDLEAKQAEYVAQAGLNHALWQTGQQGCGPYTDLTSQPLAGNSYTTTLTTDLGSTTSYPITVDQDTWIRSDQPTVNKATDSKLHIRFEGGTIERPMYRYDLSPIAANSSILSATAWFYVNKEHTEGPVDIHRLTADWAETDATWETMGNQMDSTVLATIPTQPVAGVWVSVNLTAQVQAWVNDQPNYGITLNSTSEGIHSDYASSEAAQQPYLEVIVGTPPSSPAALSATGTLANGTSRTIHRNDITLYQHPSGFNRLQPDATEGKDTYIYQWRPTLNYGAANTLVVAHQTNSIRHALLQFAMDRIPSGANVSSATLELYSNTSAWGSTTINIFRLMNSWEEGDEIAKTGPGANWTKRETLTDWDTTGGDFDPESIASAQTPGGPGWVSWDVTSLVSGWISGQLPNHGLLLAPTENWKGAEFDSSDGADPVTHPRLSITYSCACGEACFAPQSSGKVAMVVSYQGSDLGSTDRKRKDVIDSWGYDVDTYDDGLLWSLNTSNYDVVYISSTASASTVGTYFTNKTIGVVSEQGELNDELGIASGSAWPVGNSITITDSSHYITQPFSPGSLTIYQGDMEGLTVSGSEAPEIETLADWVGNGALVTLDMGAALEGGGTAAGRRVMLPIGRTVDWDQINNNGLLMLQRAIEWAMNKGAGVTSLWLSTLDDVSSSGAPGLDSWTDGEVIAFADPNLVFEPGATDGTFSSILNLDDFAGNADIDAMHYVGGNITVVSANSVDLLAGDLLLSTADNETLTSLNSLSVNDEDVFVFRPATTGDYSSGTFIFLIDGSQLHGNDTVGISLVEKNTPIGSGTLAQGSFILAITNRRDVIAFIPEDIGPGATIGKFAEFIDGPSLNFGSEIRGLELAEEEITLGGHAIPVGSILITLNNDGSSVGDNGISVNSEDIFYLTVTQTGAKPVADATLLLDGSDVNLDTSQEHLQALTFITSENSLPADDAGNATRILYVVKDPANLSLQETYRQKFMTDWGFDVTLMDDEASETKFATELQGDNPADVVYVSQEVVPTSIAAKLVEMPVGLVNESRDLIDDFGFAPSANLGGGMPTMKVDEAHYIALGMTNPVTVYGVNEWYQIAGTPIASGIQPVGVWIEAPWSGLPALLAIEAGDDLLRGSTAAGRRVQIPMGAGLGAVPVDINGLTGDGRTIIRRSIEWAAGAGGGSGGGGSIDPLPSCNGAYRDEFNDTVWSGSDGTLAWSNPWVEVGESDGPTSGDVEVRNDQSNYQLRIRDNNNGGEGVEREVNLHGATKASLSFDYRRMNLDNSGDYVAVYVSSNGTAGPWTELDQIGTTNDSSYQAYSKDISPYISAITAIRLRSSTSMGGTDTVWFDNIQIECMSP
ncbi:MAG: DNRLRE domain-containing protein [Candidatus Thiodiazotropha sp. (ex Dulcina madagascariensis)]|nr:DNRLRE domain-containing protein [Candidatus Thiodiazotropha sp. (ex Dulcina madagascariensis)]